MTRRPHCVDSDSTVRCGNGGDDWVLRRFQMVLEVLKTQDAPRGDDGIDHGLSNGAFVEGSWAFLT
ncbi:hypothetical protein IscW_ISCW005815 [Ixodes scapularis]|uniref:Uncharacterized protein n=1 Tax=Ixodes scapularis TaxID=6945 RepID=B7PQB7_IXOSC|nr:hypothetical protein IscW_ISCW005815 [Ixodes scapularis]|eukprot:XP_002435959.1 hypothetical protein IscW_ISCW005815 [Ixodes scapularis]